ASATGKKPWSGRVTVVAAGVPAQIEVGPLLGAAPIAPVAPLPPPVAPSKNEGAPPAPPPGAPLWAYLVGGAGAVATGVAVGFLVQQGADQKTFDSDCKPVSAHGESTCEHDKGALYRDFGLWVALGSIGVGAMALSTITILRQPSADSKPTDAVKAS